MRQPVTVAGAKLAEKPVLVPALIVVNVVIFLITAVQAGNASTNYASPVFSDFSLVPVLVGVGEWWRLISSGFLHFGLIHLAMNMLALWVIGRDLELLLGRLRFGAVYALSLLGGSTAVFLMSSPMAMVGGASGAVYGLMGGIAVAALRLKVSLKPVLMVIVLNIVLSLTIAQLSLLAHLGGLIAGALATAALVYAPRERRTVFQGAALGGLLVLMIALLAVKDVVPMM